MGANLALNLLDHNHSVVAFDVNNEAVQKIAEKEQKALLPLKN